MANLYDASIVVTFPADDIEHADQFLDELIEVLEDQGVEINGTATVEESVQINE